MLVEQDELQAEERTEAMPSFNHSYLCSQILRHLFQNPAIFPMPELTLDIGNGLTPDISVYPSEQVHPNFFRDIPRVRQMPLLVIEVISANQNVQNLLEKAADLVAAGVKTVWMVEPLSRSVFITTATGDSVFHGATLESDGIVLDLAALFQGHSSTVS